MNQKNQKIKIGIIGAGNMGKAIASSLLEKKAAEKNNLMIADKNPEKLQNLKKSLGITVTDNNLDLVERAKIIILATKPQDFNDLAETLAGAFNKDQLIISIMAGISLKNLRLKLKHQRIIRSMPNLAAKIGAAETVWIAGFDISKTEEAVAKKIFQSFGMEVKVKQEKYLNLATAISGSGPGYVFYFIEALIEAAESLRANRELAKKLVNQTLIGAINLYKLSGEDASTLRQKVTSKKGTTEAAIKYFEKSKLRLIIGNGIKKAFIRAKELEK